MAADFMHDRLPPVLRTAPTHQQRAGPAAAKGSGGGGRGDAKSKKGGQKHGRWVRSGALRCSAGTAARMGTAAQAGAAAAASCARAAAGWHRMGQRTELLGAPLRSPSAAHRVLTCCGGLLQAAKVRAAPAAAGGAVRRPAGGGGGSGWRAGSGGAPCHGQLAAGACGVPTGRRKRWGWTGLGFRWLEGLHISQLHLDGSQVAYATFVVGLA